MAAILNENTALKHEVDTLKQQLYKYQNQEQTRLPSQSTSVDVRIDVKAMPLKKPAFTRGVTDDKSKSSKHLVARARGIPVSNPHIEGRNYRAVVRDKAERKAMEGFECSQCECFYKTTGQHMPNLCNKSSKHKYFKPPPATPAGFWDPWACQHESPG